MGAVGRHGACEVPRATVYLDLETTGLYPPADAILEIAMVDHDGQVLLETLVRPEHVTSWPDAEALHGITPQDVENAPTLETLRPQLVEAVQGNTVVIYNAAFDRGFLEAELATAAEVRCCMIAFAEHYGEWSDWHGSYRWQSLSTAAAYVRHTWTGSAHRAVADALACRAVWRYLTEPEERQRVEAINADEQATWEAQAALRGWALADARTQQCEAARLTAWWTWWWLKRPPLEPHRPQDVRESAPGYRAQWETYAQVFTGDTLAVLEQVERAAALGLPGYRRQQDIPAHLKTDHSLRTQTATWERAALRERAYYVSRSGKRFWWLYDTRDVEAIRRQHVPRYTGQVPAHLATATQLRRARVPRSHLDSLQAVAEYYHPIAHRWYPLYPHPQRRLGDVEGEGETSTRAARHQDPR